MAKRIALLLIGSGFCSLTFQIVWIREFRLIFGVSTAASAAVLAVFMGGIGLGSIFLGPLADRHRNPLRLYAYLELFIAIFAAVTPLLIALSFGLYIRMGGSAAMGGGPATLVRLLLTTLVLGAPTFLMGGTLPAAVKAVTTEEDRFRHLTALLYGANALGAVIGVSLSTFLLLEWVGLRQTLWAACLINVVVFAAAISISRGVAAAEVPRATEADAATMAGRPRRWFIYLAAAVTGFAFFLMELVWYRMLSPLLAGTVYTFGLILILALLGIGTGGLAYSIWGRRRAGSMALFGGSCTVQALLIAVPFALGDRIAAWAVLLRQGTDIGFLQLASGWLLIAGIVVLPAALLAGLQFPLLIALLGRGGREVGRHVGWAYGCNTAGAISGSLAGGFGLLPLLTAPGAWQLVVLLLALLGVAAAAVSCFERFKPASLALPVAAALGAVLLLLTEGPTPAWRHSQIGLGRVQLEDSSPNVVIDWMRAIRRLTEWESEGRESSVALVVGVESGYTLFTNGKTDGGAIEDAQTQVMAGLIGAALHPRPKRALVIGLGTGTSAGWLGRVPYLEGVDVVELEPAVLEVARACSAANLDVMDNPKVTIHQGDGREFLLTTASSYDLIFSEPSHPYRAGVSSLFTREFYRAAAAGLSADGIFLQWLQTYEIDERSLNSVYATLLSVFPHVETWVSQESDLLLLASREPIHYDADLLRLRLEGFPFRQALAATWRKMGLPGFLSGYLGGPELAEHLASQPRAAVNSDDRMILEFTFARSVGRQTLAKMDDIRQLARASGLHRPPLDTDSTPPLDLTQLAREIGALAMSGDPRALQELERLRLFQPTEAGALAGVYYSRRGDLDQAKRLLHAALQEYQLDPWPLAEIMQSSLKLALQLAVSDREYALELFQLLAEPFAVNALLSARLNARISLSEIIGFDRYCVEALEPLEPNVPWQERFLEWRARCYQATGHARARLAEQELESFRERRDS